MVQATGIFFFLNAWFLKEMSYFSSQTSTLILPTVLFYYEKIWGAVGAQNAQKSLKMIKF